MDDADILAMLDQSIMFSDDDPDSCDEDSAEHILRRAEECLSELNIHVSGEDIPDALVQAAEDGLLHHNEHETEPSEDIVDQNEEEQQQPSGNHSRRVSPRILRKKKKRNKPKQLSKKQKNSSVKWIKPTGFECHTFSTFIEETVVNETEKTPLELFNMFIDDELLEKIAQQSNKYAHQKDGTIISTKQILKCTLVYCFTWL